MRISRTRHDEVARHRAAALGRAAALMTLRVGSNRIAALKVTGDGMQNGGEFLGRTPGT